MAYNTQPIKKDVDGRPIPQYFNAQQDEYQVLQGDHGAARSILYGPDGQPVGTQERPLEVKARDLEDLIGALATDPDALSILGRLKALADRLGDAVATPAAYTVLARLAALEQKVDQLLSQGIQLKGRIGPQTGRAKVTSDLYLLDIPTYEGSGNAVHPSVISFGYPWNGYKYWMAMSPYPVEQGTLHENPSILVSNNGYDWSVPPGLTNPVWGPPESGYYSDPELVYDRQENRLILYWRHYLPNEPSKLLLSRSSNGVTWSTPVECSMDSYRDPLSPSVMKLSRYDWRIWIGSSNGGMSMATSSDGITWTRWRDCKTNLGNLVFWHPQVTQIGGEYVAIVAGFYANQSNRYDQQTDLYYGTSKDGENWIFDPIPFYRRSGAYSRRVYRSCLIIDDVGQTRLYTSGRDFAGQERIGVVNISLAGGAIPPSWYEEVAGRKQLVYSGERVIAGNSHYSVNVPTVARYKRLFIGFAADSTFSNRITIDRYLTDDGDQSGALPQLEPLELGDRRTGLVSVDVEGEQFFTVRLRNQSSSERTIKLWIWGIPL